MDTAAWVPAVEVRDLVLDLTNDRSSEVTPAMLLTTFSLLVNGVAYDKRLDGENKICTCAALKQVCVVEKIPASRARYKMIALMDHNQNPKTGRVDVVCQEPTNKMREEK